jgi:eukaryotic-like serine/threonine-protein kinase
MSGNGVNQALKRPEMLGRRFRGYNRANMPLLPGTHLGPYEITRPLGAGGMGEVYQARDTRLGRDVAIKILPVELCKDVLRKQRFEREAKTISSLNHPNICVLHDVGSQDGVDYLVMECVEGETLAKRLERGPLPLEQALKYGAQIAAALGKAHRAGIVHRDLKPGNVMLTSSGAKLLDFGLAKEAAPLASLATVTVTNVEKPVTQEGTIVGTFQYMSPEQVEGKELDGRSDIFSLGAVLYEMVTGQKAFDGKSQLSVASAILEKEPALIATVRPMTPASLEHAVQRCLAKDPEERWQNASDLAGELKWIGEKERSASGVAPLTTRTVNAKLGWAVASVLALALAAGAVWWRNSTPSEQSMYFSAALPLPANDMAMAPNGHTLAIVGYREAARTNVIWIYEPGTQDARFLADTEGATFPFWSPDERSMAFFADGKLKRVEVAGGPAQILCDAPTGRGGTWNKDGVILFTPYGAIGEGLYRIPAVGGTPAKVTTPDASKGEHSHRWPVFLPDGKHYLFMAANFGGKKGVNAIYEGSLDSDEKHFIVDATANAEYAEPGYLLFPRESTLLAQRFDFKNYTLTGEAATVLNEIHNQPQVRRAVYAVSDSRFLVAQTGTTIALSQPVWFDRKGNKLGVVGKPGVYGNVSISPTRSVVAISRTDRNNANQNSEVWTYELRGGNEKRLTFDPSNNAVPIWSPDGSRLMFASSRGVSFDLYLKSADGAEAEKVVLEDSTSKLPGSWSRDGKYIVYTRGTDLSYLTVPEMKDQLLLKASAAFRNPQISPDGKWIAYASNETAKWQIYVTSFPEAHGKWQISINGGEQPRWRRDGKELFYLSSDYKMMAAPVTTGVNFNSDTPVPLFQTSPRQPISLNDVFVYDVSEDGRFLINTQLRPEDSVPMTVVVNWTAKLKR